MNRIFEHKHIIIGGDNLNSLSIIRSLGEKGNQNTLRIILKHLLLMSLLMFYYHMVMFRVLPLYIHQMIIIKV